MLLPFRFSAFEFSTPAKKQQENTAQISSFSFLHLAQIRLYEHSFAAIDNILPSRIK